MLGSHIIKSVGVLFFRPDKSISIKLNDDFVETMHKTSDDQIYSLVKEPVDHYVQSSARFAGQDLAAKSKYMTMAIFAHYLKNHPERKYLKAVLRQNAS